MYESSTDESIEIYQIKVMDAGTTQHWTYRIVANASSEERFFKVLMVIAAAAV